MTKVTSLLSIQDKSPLTFYFAFLSKITRHLSIDRCRENASLKRSAYIVELNAETKEQIRKASIPLYDKIKNIFICFLDTIQSSLVKSYLTFQPIGPYFLLSWTIAWKKHKEKKNVLNKSFF